MKCEIFCRLLQERKHNDHQPRDWFSSSGQVARLPNPLLEHCMRPGAGDDDAESQTVFVPALVSDTGHNLISGAVMSGGHSGHCQLELDIASLVFSHHHLFSLEHYMTRSLKKIFHTYFKGNR